MINLLDFSNPKSIRLRENDFDYWIVGFHSPESSHKYSLTDLVSILTVLTLGIIPAWGENEFKSEYWVFDSKLNLIQSIPVNQTRSYLFASWIFWKKSERPLDSFYPIDPGYYESDIKQFTKELTKVVAK